MEQRDVEVMQELMGVRRHRQRRQRLLERGRAAETGALRDTVTGLLNPVAEAVEKAITPRQTPGRYRVGTDKLRGLAPHISAYIALRTCMNKLGTSVNTIASQIGGLVEDELRLKQFQALAPGLFHVVNSRIEKSGDYRYKRRVLLHAEGQADERLEWEPWTKAEKLQVGAILVDTVVQTTKLVELRRVSYGKHNTPVELHATPEMQTWIEYREAVCEVMRPWLLPMIEEPRDWTEPDNGGYLEVRFPLVKHAKGAYLETLRQTDMPQVYKAVNRLQATPWRVNPRVLEVAEELWSTNLTVPGFPDREDTPLPEKPADIATNEEARKLWKRAASAVHQENALRISSYVSTDQLLGVAAMFSEHPTIWFPWQLDFRGRAYPMPSYLHPQGCDLAKGLLEFGEAKPLGTRGQLELARQGAALWGLDKAPSSEQVEWAWKSGKALALSVVADPLEDRRWMDADGGKKAFQFLAWCFEWAEAHDNARYVSRFVCSLDGSCNGLQHFSATLRDPRAAAAVNLLPSSAPADVYAEVCEEVRESLEVERRLHGTKLAAEWLQSGQLDRALVKRQVMTLPYGATQYGMRLMLEEELSKRLRLKGYLPFSEQNLGELASFLTPYIWNAIGRTVAAAQSAMRFLQETSKAVTDAKVPLQWTTPTGLIVSQDNRAWRRRRIKLILGGQTVRLRLREETDKLDKRRQASAVAPNWVHSMDAAHMMRTVNALPEGTSFAGVHDSFGTHACDVPLLAQVLREEFVRLYEEADWLKEWRTEVSAVTLEDVPQVPVRGGLDIRKVLESEYFFH